MSLRERVLDYSKNDNLDHLWKLYQKRKNAESWLRHKTLTFLINRSAQSHGGYIGDGAQLLGIPTLPHGLHGIYISRYATIGADCLIYQNVTIGEVNRKAPVIGDHCLIGAGAILIGNIHIGDSVRIGAGAVVNKDIPDNSTVVSSPIRILTSTD